MSTNPKGMSEVRVLVVEDELIQAKGIAADLNSLSEVDKRRFGVAKFSIHYAHSVVEAIRRLNEAQHVGLPYHLVFLDLSLPINDNELEGPPSDTGFQVLDYARLSGAAMQIIVVSRYNDFQNAQQAFRGGALDFIAKPFERESLQTQTRVSLKRLQAKNSDTLIEQRLCELFPYNEQVLAYRFGACFSGLTQDVVHEVEQLEHELGERLGLSTSTDAQDSLLRHLEALSVAVRKSKRAWAGLQSMLPGGGEEPQRYEVVSLLHELEVELLSCLKVKRVELNVLSEQATGVLSFHQDVRVVLRELMLGALCELPNYGTERKLEIALTTAQDYAQVTFSGDLFHFDEPTRAAIAQGQRQNDGRFGQAWGLSVAQHIALRGGGRLQIEPDSVTYFIPLARHD